MSILENFSQKLVFATRYIGKSSSDLYRFKKKLIISSGKHKKTSFRIFLKKDKIFRRLSFCSARKTGCSLYGTKTTYAKSKYHKNNYFFFLKKFNTFKYFSTVLRYFRTAGSIKLSCLLVNSMGQLSILPATTRMMLYRLMIGSTFISVLFGTVYLYDFLDYRFCDILFFIKHSTPVCYIAINHNECVKYVKATESRCTVYRTSFFQENIYRTLIVLPSGFTKAVDSSVTALIGWVIPKNKKSYKNTKAGFWRNLGRKPRVRGVAKNPVDHPHGGREKTVLWHRSPWGKSTKF